MKRKFGKGRIINHSQKDLWVVETDSGKAIVHMLGPKRKSSLNIDADGFRRADGQAILFHKSWWKIGDISVADIWQIGNDLLIPVSLMLPVPDDQFGKYSIDPTPDWGEELTYVIRLVKNKKRKVIAYETDRLGRISRSEAIKLAQDGFLDNVVVVENRAGNVFLRTKKNATPSDNLVT